MDPEVSRYLTFRGSISPEQQEAWFKSVQQGSSRYFIISCDSLDVGLTELKNFSVDGTQAESGIFIHDPKYRNGLLGYAAILMLLDYGFDVLGLMRVEARIYDDNRRAIRFNESLGFEKQDADEAKGLSRYVLTRHGYRSKSVGIRRIVFRGISGSAT
jgi:RimJ/RimL family protein N-acetyltransferase